MPRLKLPRGYKVLIGAATVATVLFGIVERLVGSIEKCRRQLAGGHLDNTDADRFLSDLGKVVNLHGVSETLKNREGHWQLDVLHDDDKILSTVTEQGIIRAKGYVHQAQEMHQSLVAKQVAVFIINFLEFVQVEHGQALASRHAGRDLKITRVLSEETRHSALQRLAV